MSQVLSEISSLSQRDCFYIVERHKKEFTYPLHRHKEYELNFIQNAPGVRRVVGDSVETIGDYDLVLIAGENHEKFMGWLSRAADFLGSLKDSKGRRIPVIFRPWHENLGSWFWWGGNLCTADEYKELYSLTHKYLTREKGLTNLVWAYSPNSNLTEEGFYSRYPGDGNVDIIGVDHYDYVSTDSTKTDSERMDEANAAFVKVLRSDLELLSAVAARHGKLVAVTETGFEGIPCPHWWTEVLLDAIGDASVCYVLTWRNAWDRPGHYYAPFEGSEDAENFKEFSGNDRVIFLKWKR